MIRRAGLNPLSLGWPRFLIAEEVGRAKAGRIAGIGQVKQHGDGSRELASIAVIPERQGQGIASRIIQALLAREPGPLYLTCRPELEPFYKRFGFRPVTSLSAMPPYFRRIYRLVQIFAFLGPRAPHISVMVWTGPRHRSKTRTELGRRQDKNTGSNDFSRVCAGSTEIVTGGRDAGEIACRLLLLLVGQALRCKLRLAGIVNGIRQDACGFLRAVKAGAVLR
jgi:GNAT superfamily N-acetyltransferase